MSAKQNLLLPRPRGLLVLRQLLGFVLAYAASGVAADSLEELPKLLGERVAVNARQAEILVQAAIRRTPHAGTPNMTPSPPPGAHLFAWRYSSLSPRAELDSLFAAYNLK